jgi:hypothetical protein
VCRIAGALCGKKSAAQNVVRSVMRASTNFLSRWKTAYDAEIWFIHHTVLGSRLMSRSVARSDSDCLIEHEDHPSTEYLAFVKSLRNLTPQQREAFILARFEHLNSRKIALAMDCSNEAAANHLIAASQVLTAIAGSGFETQATAVERVYASLTPPEAMIVGEVGAAARRAVRKRLRVRVMQALKMGLIVLIVWTIWRISRMIEI